MRFWKNQQERKLKTKTSKKKVKKKNREIMIVTWVFTLLFIGMAGYITYYSATHKQELINNSYNGRQQILIAQNTRGRIFSAEGEVLARTTTDSEGKEKREYPYQNLFSHVVGYASNGRMGVEAQANYYLINTSASLSQKAALDLNGEKYPGDDVYTTLRVDLQQVASTALGVYQGAVIVTEPGTGKVLAMVSKPDFDPEQISDIWDELVADEDSSILLNRVTQGLYPPGSTFKIITAYSRVWNISGKIPIYSRITAITAVVPLRKVLTGSSVIMGPSMEPWTLSGLLPSPATLPLQISDFHWISLLLGILWNSSCLDRI